MTDDKMLPNVIDKSGEAKPEPPDRKVRQSPPSAAVQPGERAAPGRRPLFGN